MLRTMPPGAGFELPTSGLSQSLKPDARSLRGPSQGDQSYTDDEEDTHAYQLSALDQSPIRLHCHYGAMSEARPRSEGNQTAMRRRVARRQQQKNSERNVKTEHHRRSRLSRQKHDQGIDSSDKQQSHQNQHTLQRPFSIHCAPSY